MPLGKENKNCIKLTSSRCRVSVGQHKYYTVEPQMKQDYINLSFRAFIHILRFSQALL